MKSPGRKPASELERRPKRAPLVIESTVAELAPGGDGLLHVDIDGERRAVFARGATVGDRVRVEVDASKRPARATALEVLAPGPDRVTAACAWALICGGCDWMHVSLSAQAKTHAEHVRAALADACRDVPIATHAPEGDAALAYRSHARLHVQTTGRGVKVGMHEAQSHDPVVVDTCAVLDPALDRARGEIAALLDGSRGRGDAQIALGKDGKPVLELRFSGEVASDCYGRLDRAVTSGAWAGARLFVGDSKRPAVIGDPTPWMRGADGEPLRLAPGGFGQASESMNRALALRVAEHARAAVSDTGRKIVELYAGAGNLTVMLARIGDVTAVESSAEACDAARANLAARDLHARVVAGDASSFAWPGGTRLIVLKPPRTGARDAVARLTEDPVRHVVYVSSDPQILGRDARVLAGAGYVVTAVDTFETSPQTSRVETVVAFERKRR